MEWWAGCGMVCVMGRWLMEKAEKDSYVGSGMVCVIDGDYQ